jgi:hypothetical protein
MSSPNLPIDIWSVYMSEASEALTGQKSAKAALDATAQRINDQLAQQK